MKILVIYILTFKLKEICYLFNMTKHLKQIYGFLNPLYFLLQNFHKIEVFLVT